MGCLSANTGWVTVGNDGDTAAFAVATLRRSDSTPNPDATDATTEAGDSTDSVAPSAAPSPSLRGLCKAYQAGAAGNPGKVLSNPAFSVLLVTAGGADSVGAYCVGLVGPAPTHPTGAPATHPGGAPATHATGAPATHPDGAPATHPTGARATHPGGAPATHPGGAPATHPTGAPATHPTGAPTSVPGRPSGLLDRSVPDGSAQPRSASGAGRTSGHGGCARPGMSPGVRN